MVTFALAKVARLEAYTEELSVADVVGEATLNLASEELE